MRKSLSKSFFLGLTLACVPLVGCKDNSSSSGSEIQIDVDYSSVKSAVESIQGANNFTVSTKIVEKMNVGTADNPVYQEINTSFHNYYTSNYSWCDYPDDEEGYAQKGGEVFRLNLNSDGDFIHSDAYLDEDGNNLTSIYDAVYNPIPDISVLNVGDDPLVASITNKSARLNYIHFLEFGDTFLTTVTSFKASVGESEGEKALLLTMESSDGTTITSTFSDFGTTAVKDVQTYLDGVDKAAVYDDILLKVADGFKGNNFTRDINELLTYEDDPAIIGKEFYHPDYWYGGYYPPSLGAIQSTGYVSLPEKTYIDPETGKSAELDGAYMFRLTENMDDLYAVYLTAPAFTTNISNMVDIMNYPSKMMMWEHNFQFFEPYQDPNFKLDGDMYITYDPLIMRDFYEIAQVENSILASTSILSCLLVDLILVADTNAAGNLETVNFLFDILLNGSNVTLQFTYHDFGTTTIPSLDQWLQTYIHDSNA